MTYIELHIDNLEEYLSCTELCLLHKKSVYQPAFKVMLRIDDSSSIGTGTVSKDKSKK